MRLLHTTQQSQIDVPSYDGDNNRLYNDSTKRPDVPKTIENFDTRALDTNYAAAYFPDVSIDDPINNRSVETPASVAVLGALAFSDSVSYPWFAPAGFVRDMSKNISVSGLYYLMMVRRLV